MKDSWIDKNEIDELISGFSKESSGPEPVGPPPQQREATEDIFDEIPVPPSPFTVASQVPDQVPPSSQPQPEGQPLSAQNHSVPLQRIVNPSLSEPAAVSQPGVVTPSRGASFASPFSIDEEDNFEDLDDIEKLASEAAQALRALKDVRARAERGGLLGERPVLEPDLAPNLDPEVEISLEPLDRIPLDLEIDPDLSLKNRLAELASILQEHVEMEEMTVVDQHGFSLFQTEENQLVRQNVAKFVDSIRKVYRSESDARDYSASQLAVDDEKWLCIIPTDGDLEGRFVLKALLGKPLDRPEVYVVVELLNEVLRPEVHPEKTS